MSNLDINKQLVIDCLGFGVGLWLFGYLLGVVLFFVVPPALLGWVIMPFGTAAALLVLFKKIKATNFCYYLILGACWTASAILFDYLFLVKLLNPADGYYKLDVYLYYLLTLVLPILIWKIKKGYCLR